MIAIGTTEDDMVDVTVEIAESFPDHSPGGGRRLIVERGLALPSGIFMNFGPTEYLPDVARIDAESGQYQCRIFVGTEPFRLRMHGPRRSESKSAKKTNSSAVGSSMLTFEIPFDTPFTARLFSEIKFSLRNVPL